MLEAELGNLKAAAAKRIPPDTLATMMRCRRQLEQSGIMAQVIQPGTPLPDAELPDASGKGHVLSDLHQGGPLLITLYRGVW